mgnify:CR=1 FL=1
MGEDAVVYDYPNYTYSIETVSNVKVLEIERPNFNLLLPLEIKKFVYEKCKLRDVWIEKRKKEISKAFPKIFKFGCRFAQVPTKHEEENFHLKYELSQRAIDLKELVSNYPQANKHLLRNIQSSRDLRSIEQMPSMDLKKNLATFLSESAKVSPKPKARNLQNVEGARMTRLGHITPEKSRAANFIPSNRSIAETFSIGFKKLRAIVPGVHSLQSSPRDHTARERKAKQHDRSTESFQFRETRATSAFQKSRNSSKLENIHRSNYKIFLQPFQTQTKPIQNKTGEKDVPSYCFDLMFKGKLEDALKAIRTPLHKEYKEIHRSIKIFEQMSRQLDSDPTQYRNKLVLKRYLPSKNFNKKC